MSENNTSDSYEVGFGKPPESTQFKKGVSGNPKGRPKKPLDFDDELLRESRSSITLNDNGRLRRISKLEAVVKQMTNKAMSGNMPAARIYLDRLQVALEKAALREAAKARELERRTDLRSLSDEELEKLLAMNRKGAEQERKKGHISNAD